MVSDYLNRPKASDLSLKIAADTMGIIKYLSKEEILKLYLPEEVKRVVNEYYYQGMLGGGIYLPGIKMWINLLRYYEKIAYRHKPRRKQR